MGELGGVLEGVVHALRNEFAHVGHLHHFELGAFSGYVGVVGFPDLQVGTFNSSGQAASRSRRSESAVGHLRLGQPRQGSLGGGCGFHVAGDDASVRACSGNAAGIHTLFSGYLACAGRCGSAGGFSRSNLCHPRRHKREGPSLLAGRGRALRDAGRGKTCIGGEFGKGLAGFADDHYIRQNGNLVPVLEKDGKDGSRHFCFFLEGRLVGFITEQDVPYSDLVTRFFFEFGDDAALHGLALFGHNDDMCHILCEC